MRHCEYSLWRAYYNTFFFPLGYYNLFSILLLYLFFHILQYLVTVLINFTIVIKCELHYIMLNELVLLPSHDTRAWSFHVTMLLYYIHMHGDMHLHYNLAIHTHTWYSNLHVKHKVAYLVLLFNILLQGQGGK